MRYLCYFVHRHLDFRVPELESLYEMALQRHPGGELQEETQGQGKGQGQGEGKGQGQGNEPQGQGEGEREAQVLREEAGAEAGPAGPGLDPDSSPCGERDSNGAEAQAAAGEGPGAKGRKGRRGLKWWKPEGDPRDSPFFFADLPSDEVATFMAHRSILLKGVFEVWGEGLSWEELEDSVRRCPRGAWEPFLGPQSSFKIVVDGFGRVVPHAEQLRLMERLAFLPFKGKVDLKSPQHKFWLIMCRPPANDDTNFTANGLPPDLPPRLFFGRQVAVSDRAALVTKYGLGGRSFLGPTAMDAELALIMANQALARPGSFVYDPFAGTGSILVAAAHFGAATMGADIDIRTIRDGKGPNSNLGTNFQQYSLPQPVGLMRADNNCPPWRKDLHEVFHAVVCDPPYGVRAGGRKSGGRKLLKGVGDEPYIIPDDLREDHIPSTAPYTLEECLADLLDCAARLLTLGGRLVFFYPALREKYEEEELPRHECLELVGNSEQILTRVWSRRLLTMEKARPYTADVAARHAAAHQQFRESHAHDLALAKDRAALFELREAVFRSPACEMPAARHRKASVEGMDPARPRENNDAHQRPSYRAKCV